MEETVYVRDVGDEEKVGRSETDVCERERRIQEAENKKIYIYKIK